MKSCPNSSASVEHLMPGEDPFEIAKRLDRYGAGKGTKPPRQEKTDPVVSTSFTKRKSRSSGTLLAVILVVLAVAVWLASRRTGSPPDGRIPTRTDRTANPADFRSQPPQTIPALNGQGEVPAFTVQVPGDAPPATTQGSGR